MQNNFELNHYPRKYGKTHILVNEMFNYIYKTNAKNRIVIYAANKNQVEYISDIITCNLDYQYEETKRYIGRTNNKFINPKYVIIVGTYKFHLKNRKQDDSVDLVLFDELPREDDYNNMKHIISKYPKAIFKAYYTSELCSTYGPFQKEIFDELILKKFSEETVNKLSDKYKEDLIVEVSKLKETLYDIEDVKFTLNEKITIDKFIKKTEELNEKDLNTRNTVERVLYSNVNSIKVKYCGMLLINQEREDKITELYDKFMDKIKSFEKE